jgi:hypothetical protein
MERRNTVQIEIRTLEYMLGVAGLIWGFIVILPDLDTYGATTAYRALQRIGIPEWLLGLSVLSVSILRLVSVRYKWMSGRMVSGALGCFQWLTFSILIVVNNLAMPGWVIYCIPALLSMVIFSRLASRASWEHTK